MDLNVFKVSGTSVYPSTEARSTANSEENFADILAAALARDDETGYDRFFDAAAEKYQVSSSLLKALGKTESAFQADAVSCCGAQGIMQLMPNTARAMGVGNSFDPAQNIMGGAKYLRQMLDRFDGNVSLALAAYNAGPGTVARCHGVPKACRNYVSKVLGYVDTFSDSTTSANVPMPDVPSQPVVTLLQEPVQPVIPAIDPLSTVGGNVATPVVSQPVEPYHTAFTETETVEDIPSSVETTSEELLRVIMERRFLEELMGEDEEEEKEKKKQVYA